MSYNSVGTYIFYILVYNKIDEYLMTFVTFSDFSVSYNAVYEVYIEDKSIYITL